MFWVQVPGGTLLSTMTYYSKFDRDHKFFKVQILSSILAWGIYHRRWIFRNTDCISKYVRQMNWKHRLQEKLAKG